MAKLARPSRASTPSPECLPGNWRIAAGGWGGMGRNGAGKGRGKRKGWGANEKKGKARPPHLDSVTRRFTAGQRPEATESITAALTWQCFHFWPRRGSAIGARIFLRGPLLGCRIRTPCAEFRIESPSPIRESALRLPIGYVMDARSAHKDRDVYPTRW